MENAYLFVQHGSSDEFEHRLAGLPGVVDVVRMSSTNLHQGFAVHVQAPSRDALDEVVRQAKEVIGRGHAVEVIFGFYNSLAFVLNR